MFKSSSWNLTTNLWPSNELTNFELHRLYVLTIYSSIEEVTVTSNDIDVISQVMSLPTDLNHLLVTSISNSREVTKVARRW